MTVFGLALEGGYEFMACQIHSLVYLLIQQVSVCAENQGVIDLC